MPKPTTDSTALEYVSIIQPFVARRGPVLAARPRMRDTCNNKHDKD